MTPEAEETRKLTQAHIDLVGNLIEIVICMLTERRNDHDASKLKEPEFAAFCKATAKLKGLTYGSPEYAQELENLGPALEHHYKVNRHHPEHFNLGINEMTLIDLIELLMDWWAATTRHADGDIDRSLKINMRRFGMSKQLAKILNNTVQEMKRDRDVKKIVGSADTISRRTLKQLDQAAKNFKKGKVGKPIMEDD